MRKRLTSIGVSLVMLLANTAVAMADEQDVVILYENDVHCAIEGYSKLAAMKKELQQEHSHVGVVSSGDFVQGSSLGSISKGGYIVELMNQVGYDAVTLGNHEFGYKMERLNELIDMMDPKPICCNFQAVGESESYLKPYSIVSYGDTKIAYIGITTPSTLVLSSPSQFIGDDGEYIYTFNIDNIYDVVQHSIDEAEKEGADYIVALSHVGYEEEGTYEDVIDLIQNTSGFDVVLDGHSHSVIENMIVEDKDGNEVVLTSTGTQFEYIGKLTISDTGIKTELIPTAEYTKTDAEIDRYIENINNEYAKLGERKIGVSEIDLITHEGETRIIRTKETNLGDLCADAYRFVSNAEVSYLNGGAIRAEIKKGDITFNDIYSVFPFDDKVVVAEASGQDIKDMLEMAMMYEYGSFPHVSGITFSVNTAIPSSVTVDQNEVFTGVSGQYRVYDIKVLNSESGVYEPIDLNKTYRLGSHAYLLLEYGSGMQMFDDAKIIQNDGMLAVELLEKYIAENCNGVIGQEYAEMSPNITFTEGEIITEASAPAAAAADNGQMWICAGLILVISTVFFFAADRKTKK